MMTEKSVIFSSSREKTLKFGDILYPKDYKAEDWVFQIYG